MKYLGLFPLAALLGCEVVNPVDGGRMDDPQGLPCSVLFATTANVTAPCQGASFDLQDNSLERPLERTITVTPSPADSTPGAGVETLVTVTANDPVTLDKEGVLHVVLGTPIERASRVVMHHLDKDPSDPAFSSECWVSTDGATVDCPFTSFSSVAIRRQPGAPDALPATVSTAFGVTISIPQTPDIVDLYTSHEGSGPCGKTDGQRGFGERGCRVFVYDRALEIIETPDVLGSTDLDLHYGPFLTATLTSDVAERKLGNSALGFTTTLHRLDDESLALLGETYEDMQLYPTTKSAGDIGVALVDALRSAGVDLLIGHESLRFILELVLVQGQEQDVRQP